MNRFPQMVYRDGSALPEHGVDFLIVECEAELFNALADGWREELEASCHPLDHDCDGEKGGPIPTELRKRGRPKKAAV